MLLNWTACLRLWTNLQSTESTPILSAKAAREAGLKAALSGLGGDEFFGGYSDFQDIPRLVYVAWPFKWLPGLGKGFRLVAAPIIKRFTSPKYAGIFEYGGDWEGAYLLRRGLFMPWELPELLEPELVREGWCELETLSALHHSIDALTSNHLKVIALETAWYMRNQLLRDTDWASMAHSVEVRVPLVDVALFRTVVRLIHSDQIPTKSDLAASPVSPLPAVLLDRKKSGFSVPVRDWSLQSGEKSRIKNPELQRGLRAWALKVCQTFPLTTN